MRKIYAALLTLFFLIAVSQSSVGQSVNTYNFSVAGGGSLDPMTGATTIVNSSVDDTPSSIQNIGFTFTYEGVAYTQFSASPDGFMRLGATAASAQFTNSITSTTNIPKLFPYWDDLATGTTGNVRFVVTGTAPNRILKVQWFVTVPRVTAGAANSTFQAWLYETTNVIEFRYGTGVGPSPSASIGVNGATATNFISVSTPANTSSITVANNSNTVLPGSETIYTFAPPGPCTGTPVGGTTQSTSASVCAGVSFTLSVSGVPNATGYTYQWQSSPDGVTWTDIPVSIAGGNTNEATLTRTQSTNTYYRRRISCGANSSFSSSLLVSMAVAPLPLFEDFASTTFPPGCWVRNNATFLFRAASSAYGIGAGSARFDFYNSAAGTQLELTSPVFTPAPAGYFLSFDHAYATFAGEVDRLEILYSTNGGASYTNLVTYNGGTSGPLNTGGAVGPSFVPLATQWATKAMALPTGTNRILFRGVSAFGNNLYLDNIRLVTCLPPSGLTASAITTTTATVSWTASASNPSNGYQWEVRTSGAGGSGATGLTTSGSTAAGVTTANAAGLTANTTYNLYVRSDCGGSDFSVWAGPFTFVTECNALTLPFTETFTSTTFPPTCWKRNNTTFLLRGASNAYGAAGTGSARFNFWAATSGTFDLTTPIFTATPAGYGLIFDHAYATFSGEVDRLEIHYSTDGGNSYTLLTTYLGGAAGPLNTGGVTGNPFASFVPTASQWATKSMILPTGTNRLIFRGISAFGDDLFVDNIGIASCLPPSGLSTTAVTQTTATANWTASISNPSNGYQWEVRTSGAGGSGATGLTTSGTTAAGVTTASVTGLTANTAYNLYVRSDCGGSDFSAWAGPYAFRTPCNPVGLPLLENFTSTTFPPTCWTISDAVFMTRSTANAYVTGTGSAKFDFYNAASGTQLNLTSPVFTPTGAGYGLVFDHAYATFAGEVDQLQIFYSTDGGSTYTSLVTYNGGTNGPLNTGGAVLPAFTPTIAQWGTKSIVLPTGTNRLIFRGISAFGNNLYLDNIQVVSCTPPTGVTLSAVAQTTATASWTASPSNPSGGYQWEVRTSGAAGSGATGLTASGTTAAGVTTVNLTGLTAGTAYNFYVRSDCGAADYSVWIGPRSFRTLCNAINIFPYTETFETSSTSRDCWKVDEYVSGTRNWTYGAGAGNGGAVTTAHGGALNARHFGPGSGDITKLVSPPLDLSSLAANGAKVEFWYANQDWLGDQNQLRVYYKTSAAGTWTLIPGAVYTSNVGAWTKVDLQLPNISNEYFIAFEAVELFGWGVAVDDVTIRSIPVVDVGISSITLPNITCPVNNVFIQAEIKNYNVNPVNFSTTPVNVNARITRDGSVVTNLPATVINSGVLAPNATMGIYLGTAYNFVAGVHEIVLNTTSPLDAELTNDTLRRTVVVNPNPPTPVITPASPQICLGGSVQLTVPTPAPIATSLSATTGSIAVAVPDGSATGVTSTLAINGIPSTATVTGISVTMNMTHTWVNDMSIGLKAPNGKILNLFNRRGAAGADNLVNTVISSASTTSLATGAAPFTGTFAADAAIGVGPTGNVSDAAGFPDLYSVGSGNWTLVLRDHVGLDAGTLTSWSITINYSYIPALTWSPITELFTDAATTTPYVAGTNAYTVYAKPTVTRTYTATSTGAGGCTSTGTVTVTVNPNPVVTIGNIPDTVCISDQVVPLIGNPVGGTWSGIGVSGNNFLPPTTAVGNFTLTYNYVNAFGCPGSATKRIIVEDCPERIILLRDNAIVLFPNPTDDGRFNIRINSVLYNNLTMRVYTNNGAIVRTQKFTGLVYGRVVPIDLSALPGGVYIVEFAHENAGPRTAEKSFKVIIGH